MDRSGNMSGAALWGVAAYCLGGNLVWSQELPRGVTAHRDQSYARVGEQELLLDVYVPDDAPAKLPLYRLDSWRCVARRQ